MKLIEIEKALDEAKLFISQAEALLNTEPKTLRYGNKCEFYQGKHAASLRRKSMDLTRQLAKMRNTK